MDKLVERRLEHFETNEVAKMKDFLSKLSLNKHKGFNTSLEYNPLTRKSEGNFEDLLPDVTGIEHVLLTIQKNGSAEEDYKSVSTHPKQEVSLPVGGYDGGLYLLVGEGVSDPDKRLINPCKLSLKHVIRYEQLKRII